MSTAIEAYRQGYEKGRSDSAGGRLAEMTMGVLRDDPGGHFQRGYSDGAAGKAFDPPPAPAQKRAASGLIPKFSENPIGWFLGVLIVVEFWALWQLIKAPFVFAGCLVRKEKPSPWVVAKTVIAGGLIAIALLLPRLSENRSPGAYIQPAQQAQPSAVPPSAPVQPVTYGNGNQISIFSRLVGQWDGHTIWYDTQDGQYKRGAEQHCEFVRDARGVKFIGLDGQVLAEDDVYLTYAGGKFSGSYLFGKHGGTHGALDTQSFAFELKDDGTLVYTDSTWKHEYHKRP